MEYKECYRQAVNELNPSPKLIVSVKAGKERRMKKFSKRKIAIAAVVACMTIGTTVFAAGCISTYMVWSEPGTENTDYGKACETAQEADIEAAIPETLSNGYAFGASNNGGMKGVDENGNTLAEGEMFQVTYQKADCPDLSLYVQPIIESEDHSGATASKEIRGVTVYYNKDTYKMVPTDYQLTEDDERNQKDPHFYISYGAEEVEIECCESILFEIDGKSYNLLGFNCEMTQEEWFKMADQFIK